MTPNIIIYDKLIKTCSHAHTFLHTPTPNPHPWAYKLGKPLSGQIYISPPQRHTKTLHTLRTPKPIACVQPFSQRSLSLPQVDTSKAVISVTYGILLRSTKQGVVRRALRRYRPIRSTRPGKSWGETPPQQTNNQTHKPSTTCLHSGARSDFLRQTRWWFPMVLFSTLLSVTGEHNQGSCSIPWRRVRRLSTYRDHLYSCTRTRGLERQATCMCRLHPVSVLSSKQSNTVHTLLYTHRNRSPVSNLFHSARCHIVTNSFSRSVLRRQSFLSLMESSSKVPNKAS